MCRLNFTFFIHLTHNEEKRGRKLSIFPFFGAILAISCQILEASIFCGVYVGGGGVASGGSWQMFLLSILRGCF